MEGQDIPAIVAAAHAKGVPVALENSYAAGILLGAFSFDVDVSMQALTKYVGGHSDLILGSISVGTKSAYERVLALRATRSSAATRQTGRAECKPHAELPVHNLA